MASKFFDQEAREVDETPRTPLTLADALAIVGVLAILVGPFTVALAVVIAR